MSKQKTFKPHTNRSPKVLLVWVGVFSTIGIATAVLTMAAPVTPKTTSGSQASNTSVASQPGTVNTTSTTKTNPTRTVLILAGAATASVFAAAVMAKYLGMPHASQTASEPLTSDSSSRAMPSSQPALPTLPGTAVSPTVPVPQPAPAPQTDGSAPSAQSSTSLTPSTPVTGAIPQQPMPTPSQAFIPADLTIPAEQIQSGQPPTGSSQSF